MPVDKALEELEKYALDFANIGDAKQAIKNNKDEFLHKWIKVLQYYSYVIARTVSMSDEWFKAVDILSDIIIKNPSLKKWVYRIMDPKYEENQVQSKSTSTVNIASFLASVDTLIGEVKNMQSFDANQIEEIEWQLYEYQKMVDVYQKLLGPDLYQRLMSDIKAALIKINQFNDIIESTKRI